MSDRIGRVAALYDAHGMADALAAVLAEVEREGVDAIVAGGDTVAGPQPAETMALLRGASAPVHWIRGNGDRELGEPGVGEDEAVLAFNREQLGPADVAFCTALPETVTLDIDGLGPTLFCHATPRSDLELITPGTPDAVFERVLDGVEERVVLAGHTHMQLDRTVAGRRWVNAGSVGFPFEGEVAAFWALLGPDVKLRRTPFDTERAAAAIRATAWPPAEAFVAENLEVAIGREQATELFERLATERGER